MPIINSISGLRATLGDSLLPNLISNYVAAFDKVLPKGTVVVGRDGRPSGEWIEKIVLATFSACRRDTIAIGIVPTPTVQLSVETNDNAVGGISITASHNPEQWNGLKFINKEGVFCDLIENLKISDAIKFGDFNFSKTQEFGKTIIDNSAIDKHIQKVLDIPLLKNGTIEKIISKKYKVVVDAVNASGSVAIPKLLKKMGCEVIEMFCDGSGKFPHTPEPIPKNLSRLAEEVKKQNADLGIAVDPDADRLVLIDDTAKPIGEEKTIVLAIESVLNNMNLFLTNDFEAKVVVNQSTSKMVDDIASKYSVEVERSSVGEINVVKTMKKRKAIIGGEGSGGVILPHCHYGRDSLVGTALILSLMALRSMTLSELSDSLPKYFIFKKKCVFKGDWNNLQSKLIKFFPNGKAIKSDGIKIIFTKSWFQVRASNTEPIVRILAEDVDEKEAKRLVNQVMKICNKV